MEKQSRIRVLNFPDNVRLNPHQLLGDLNDSSVLIREIFDNSRDELMASGSCDRVWVNNERELNIVADNGRGISIEMNDDVEGATDLEMAIGSIFAGGKYDSEIAQGGMHGIGSSAVNAVSDVFIAACKVTSRNWESSYPWLKDEISSHFKGNVPKDSNHLGYYLVYRYHKGVKHKTWLCSDDDLHEIFGGDVPTKMSTYIGFTPDDTIVKSSKAPFSTRWSEYTQLVMDKFFDEKKVDITLNGESLVSEYKPMKFEVRGDILKPDSEVNKKIQVYLGFEFSPDLNTESYSGSVNCISVYQGLHIQLAKWIVTYNLRTMFGITHKMLSKGLHLDISILANKVGYSSQTKDKLVAIKDFKDDDWYALDEQVKKVFTDNYDEIFAHVERLNEYHALTQDLAAKDYVTKMVNISGEGGTNAARSWAPIKLKDASSSDRSKCELFICEGDSAGGSLMKGRDHITQAVMPLRGKSLNAVFRTLDDIFLNEEIKDIISAIGMGVDIHHSLDNARYSKIIIASDSDADGAHINALVLGLFAAHMSFLLDAGMIYILESPLYEQDGKFIYPGEEDELLDRSRYYSRFKGLGSLKGIGDIKQVLTNPDTRRLIRVMPDDIARAISVIGDKHTRRRIMMEQGLVASFDEYADESEDFVEYERKQNINE